MRPILTLFFICITLCCSNNVLAQSKQIIKFNHSGIQKGAISMSCYHEPCSVGKVLSFKQLTKTKDTSRIALVFQGGEKMWDSNKITWDKGTEHNHVEILCSVAKPTVILDLGHGEKQIDVLAFNPDMGISGVMMSTAELYMQACHNIKDKSWDNIVKKYGYNVKEKVNW